jgi:conjugal transfer/type IV secretion protein DotA/TraY
MYVVMQGIGAADQLWNVALGYMQRSGTIVEQPFQTMQDQAGGVDNSFLIDQAGAILKSEVCMAVLNRSLKAQNSGQKAVSPGFVPDFMNSLTATGKGPDGLDTGKPIDYRKDIGGYLQFPGYLPSDGGIHFNKYRGACGNISWNFIDAPHAAGFDHLPTIATDSVGMGINQMVWNLQPIAANIANTLIPIKSTTQQFRIAQPGKYPIGGLTHAAGDFYAIAKPGLREAIHRQKKKVLEQKRAFIQTAKEGGWIMAGSYYYRLALLNQGIQSIGTNLEVPPELLTADFSPNFDGGLFASTQMKLKNFFAPATGEPNAIDRYIQDEHARLEQQQRTQNVPLYSWHNYQPKTWFGKLIHIFTNHAKFFQKRFQNALEEGNDPIFALAKVGNQLIFRVEIIWLGILTAFGLKGGGLAYFSSWLPTSWMGANSVTGAINFLSGSITMLAIVMPLASFWLIFNLILGATLSYYVPLIPFLLFFFGTITWFTAVIEAMIAAPLVALGITHPEGHDLLGKAEQSVMLLANVFLRPMLMIFGFIFGIILCVITLHLFNYGFSIATEFISEMNGDWLVLVTQTAMTFIYTSAALTIVTRSFGMIYEVPNRVLRWIGGPAENTHEAESLAHIRGVIESGTREAAYGAKGVGDTLLANHLQPPSRTPRPTTNNSTQT